MEDGVSILICCYNSSWIIDRALKNILHQNTRDVNWELIVVNNNSTDDTGNIVHQILDSSNISCRVINVSKQGLLYARIEGGKAAKYKYTLWCDDDNLLDEDYVYNMYNEMETHPEWGACGGLGSPEFTIKPAPIVERNLLFYAIGPQDNNAKNYFLFGSGACLRTELFKDIVGRHQFHLIGRCGNRLLSGDDSEVMNMICLRGYSLGYNEKCTFVHVLASHRLSEKYFFSLMEGLGMSNPILSVYSLILNDRSFVYFYKELLSTLKFLFLSLFQKGNDVKTIQIKQKIGFMKGLRFFGIRMIYKIYKQTKEEAQVRHTLYK